MKVNIVTQPCTTIGFLRQISTNLYFRRLKALRPNQPSNHRTTSATVVWKTLITSKDYSHIFASVIVRFCHPPSQPKRRLRKNRVSRAISSSSSTFPLDTGSFFELGLHVPTVTLWNFLIHLISVRWTLSLPPNPMSFKIHRVALLLARL